MKDVMDYGFSCCFCGESIKPSKIDITSLLVTINFEKEEKLQYDQQIWCHYNCLKSKLPKDFPLALEFMGDD